MSDVFSPKVDDIVWLRREGQRDRRVRVVEVPDDRHPMNYVVTEPHERDQEGVSHYARIFELAPMDRGVSSTIVGHPFETKLEPRTDAVVTSVMDPLKAIGSASALFDPSNPDPAVDQIRERLGLRQPTAEKCESLIEQLSQEGVRFSYDPETPDRMARALRELTSGYGIDVAKLLKTFPVEGDAGMVVVRDIPFASLCEHHVLPFSGTVSVVYIPTDRIVGLSKIPRLVRAVSRRLQVQERIGVQVADALMQHVRALAVMVVIKGRHSCMALRGIESAGEMVTSCVRGAFTHNSDARAEALQLIR